MPNELDDAKPTLKDMLKPPSEEGQEEKLALAIAQVTANIAVIWDTLTKAGLTTQAESTKKVKEVYEALVAARKGILAGDFTKAQFMAELDKAVDGAEGGH